MEDPFMHSLCFDDCLLDPETKPNMKGKRVIFQYFRVPFAQSSNQLTWASEVSSDLIKQLAWVSTIHLDE